MWKIGNVEIENQIAIAPMAGISNVAFRELIKEFGAGLIYSEMVSDKAICFNNKKSMQMLEVSKHEHPLVMQLFGYEVDTMVKAAIVLDNESDCDIIDINMGCPVKKIVSNGSGAALMKTPELAYDIVSNIVKVVKKPVTVKIRAGWDKQSINCVEFAKLMEKAGASAIAIHGRTRSQMYAGESDLNHIKAVKESVSIPVIGNGDVTTLDDFVKMLEVTGCDAVMIGRKAMQDPWFIKQCNDYLQNKTIKEVAYKEKFETILKHAQKLIELYGENLAMRQMRGHAMWSIQGIPYSAKIKPLFNRMNTYEELKSILVKYEDSLDNEDFSWLYIES